jgi:hypothetical protein
LDSETLDVNGEIENNGTEQLDFVRVTVTFYDANNSILGSDFTEPNTLDPGQSAPFKLNVGYGDNIPISDIASIKLHIGAQ